MRVRQNHQSRAGLHPRQPDLRLRFAAKELAIRAALHQSRRWMIRARLQPDFADRAELALAEILNNVAEHAYHGVKAGEIELFCRSEADGLRIALRDWGCALPQTLLDDHVQPQLIYGAGDPMKLPDGGFGWHIIRQLAQDIVSQRRNGENYLTCLVPLRSARAQDATTDISGESATEIRGKAVFPPD